MAGTSKEKNKNGRFDFYPRAYYQKYKTSGKLEDLLIYASGFNGVDPNSKKEVHIIGVLDFIGITTILTIIIESCEFILSYMTPPRKKFIIDNASPCIFCEMKIATAEEVENLSSKLINNIAVYKIVSSGEIIGYKLVPRHGDELQKINGIDIDVDGKDLVFNQRIILFFHKSSIDSFSLEPQFGVI